MTVENRNCGKGRLAGIPFWIARSRSVLIAFGVHAIILSAAACLTIVEIGINTNWPFFARFTNEQIELEYDESLERCVFKTPKIITSKITERPICMLEEETDTSNNLPQGISADNFSNKDLRSRMCVDAYGIGGGACGAYGTRWGRGSFCRHGGSAGQAGGKKWLSGPTSGKSGKRYKRKWIIAPRGPEGRPTLVNVPYIPHEDKKKAGEKETTPDGRPAKKTPVNPFVDTAEDYLSTFAVDVDTASFTMARNYLKKGKLPPEDIIRVEEFVNYMKYEYEPPIDGTFAIHLEGAPSKFGTAGVHKMLRVALKGRDADTTERKPAILTFVVDISGSMDKPDRLPLVKKSLRLLLDQMIVDDCVGIVLFGSEAKLVTEPLSMSSRKELERAIDSLAIGGATNAEAGLKMGYEMAEKYFVEGAINRVILCSDGAANVGATGPDSIRSKIKKSADKGIYLTTVGFGLSGYNDRLMEQLADKGDGNYAFVDDLKEAKRVFVDNLNGTLQPIAKDVKVQVAFNHKVVRSWRLIGYENRHVDNKDFRNDKIDAGEVGVGHSVTALYELEMQRDVIDGAVASVTIRYKDPDNDDKVSEFSRTIDMSDFADDFSAATADYRLAVSTAELAEILRGSRWAEGSDLTTVLEIAQDVQCEFAEPECVEELVKLVENATKIKARRVAALAGVVSTSK